MHGVSKTHFENYVKANDVVLRNMQNQGQGLQNQMTNLTEMLSKFISSNTASSSSSVLFQVKPKILTLRVGNDELVFYAEKSEKSKNKQFINCAPTLATKIHSLNKKDEDETKTNSNVSNSDELVFLNTSLTDKVECFDPEDNIDEIDVFLAMEVSSNFEEGYYDSEGDVIFLESLLSDDTTHNLAPEFRRLNFKHIPSRIAREHEEYLSLMTLLCEISTSRSPENVHANSSSIIESCIPVEDSDPVQEEIDIFLVPGDLIPPGVENDDSEDEDNSTFLPENESSILEPSSPRPPPEPPDVCLNFKPDTAMKNDEDFNQGEIVLSLNVEDVNSFTFVIWTFLPSFTYPEDSPFILSFGSEDLVFDPGIFVLHFSYLEPVVFSMEVSYSKIDPTFLKTLVFGVLSQSTRAS
ncbi:hypothetical protein Tco_0349730 [Tanacetum coccineum]